MTLQEANNFDFVGNRTVEYVVTERNNKLEIKPLELDRVQEYTVFDALRDNKGKGIDAEDLLRILEKING